MHDLLVAKCPRGNENDDKISDSDDYGKKNEGDDSGGEGKGEMWRGRRRVLGW